MFHTAVPPSVTWKLLGVLEASAVRAYQNDTEYVPPTTICPYVRIRLCCALFVAPE